MAPPERRGRSNTSPGVRGAVTAVRSVGRAKKGTVGGESQYESTEERAQSRVESSGNGSGLPDTIFDASGVVADLHGMLAAEIPRYAKMTHRVYEAAGVLDDSKWEDFVQLCSIQSHRKDLEAFEKIFHSAEAASRRKGRKGHRSHTTAAQGWREQDTWNYTMLGGGMDTAANFLHLGTVPISEQLCEFFKKKKIWKGVSVAPAAPRHISKHLVKTIEMDPSSEKDSDRFLSMLDNEGGPVPQPRRFKVVMLDLIFNQLQPEADEDGVVGEEPQVDEGRPGTAGEQPSTTRTSRQPSKSSAAEIPGLTRLPPVSPPRRGFGNLGVTLSDRVRRCLRTLRNLLTVGLHRLQGDGFLVLFWGALPYHPVLLFITRNLRQLFERVHLLAHPSCETMETYILCAGFQRENVADTSSKDSSPLSSFFGSVLRNRDLDDVLLWTLTDQAAIQEAKGDPKTVLRMRGYPDLWATFEKKYMRLADDPDSAKKALIKPKARPKDGRRESGRESLPSPEPDGSSSPKRSARGEGRERRSEAPTAPSAERSTDRVRHEQASTHASPASAHVEDADLDPNKIAPRRRVSASPVQARATESSAQGKEEPQSPPRPRSPRLVTRKSPMRNQPWLSCSLGAAPGTMTAPDPEAFAGEFPIISAALRTQNRRLWHLPKASLARSTGALWQSGDKPLKPQADWLDASRRTSAEQRKGNLTWG